MDAFNIEEKYKKLATEYSKLRAQAGVLKRAVLEEQNKNATMREAFRIKETNLRRVEQELDSLGFRNKQLEHRVASLQDDLGKDAGKKLLKNSKATKWKQNVATSSQLQLPLDSSVLSDEFQKKIFECVQLTSNIADKAAEIQLQTTRIEELEALIRSMSTEHSEMDARLRKEIERLMAKNHDLEAKLVEASSIVGSDDTLYVSEYEHQLKSNNSNSSNNCMENEKIEDRLSVLEKEIVYWRTQYELLQITAGLQNGNNVILPLNKLIECEITKQSDETPTTNNELRAREKLIIDHYSKKIEDLFMKKCLAESKLAVYMEECDSLQKNLDIVNNDFKEQEQKFRASQSYLRLADEDMATTRINYEEQISVLTEQVINLSDELANLK